MRFPIVGATLLSCATTLFTQPGASPGGPRPAGVGVPAEATLSPYFWVKSEDPALDQLPLKSTSVRASIAGVIADVKVTQVYRNEGRKPLEAVYVFPGSTRAAVYGMKMTLGERTIEAKIREKEQARKEYEQARQEGRSASLLEQHRPNVFQMNVANIMPGDEIRVELSYTELLVPTEGIYEFVYPTVVGPRYSGIPGTASSTGEKWVASPYTKEGEAPLSAFDLELRLAAGMPIQHMACATHKTSITFDSARSAQVKLDPAEQQGGNRDFILKYQLAGGQIQSGLLLGKGHDENFFLLMVQPPEHVKPSIVPPREFVFIMDVSGSMHGYPLETSKVLVRDLVGHLRPEDRFNLMIFEGASAWWSPGGSQLATAENLRNALAFVNQQQGGGGTEIGAALKRALALPRAEGFSRTFVIATDGYVSVEPQVLDIVRNGLGGANMFAFGIGTSVNRCLIEGIAHAGLGEPFVVTKPEEAAAQAERFRQYVSNPVLTQVKAAFKGFQTYDVEPVQIPDVLADRPILCFGKWKGEPTGTIEVSGITGSGSYQQTFRVADSAPSESNGALRYLWARHRIQLLGDYAGLGDAEGQKKSITELGLKYGLLTNYTSFVAIDSQVRNASGQAEAVTQPLPLPEGVSNLAVGAGCMARGVPCKSLLRYECKEKSGPVPCRQAADATPAITRVDSLTTDHPALATSGLKRDLDSRLKDPVLSRWLSALPVGSVLVLRVDASGQVIGASFENPCPIAPLVLKSIRAWHFASWSEPGITLLRVVLTHAAD